MLISFYLMCFLLELHFTNLQLYTVRNAHILLNFFFLAGQTNNKTIINYYDCDHKTKELEVLYTYTNIHEKAIFMALSS